MIYLVGKSTDNMSPDKIKSATIVSLIFILLLFIIGVSPYIEEVKPLRMAQAFAKGGCIITYLYEIIKHLSVLWRQKSTRYNLLFALLILLSAPFSKNPQLALAPLYVLLSFPFFYVMSKERKISNKQIVIFLLIGLVLASNNTIQYYYKFDTYSIEEIYEGNYTNNSSYTIALLLPFFFLLKRRANYWFLIIPSCFLVLISQKRGAILSSSIFLLSYLYLTVRNSSKKTRFFSLIAVAFLFFLVYSGLSFFLHRFVDASSSGRSEMYPFYLSRWMDGSFLRLLFGNGLYATMDLLFNGNSLYAHSDFVEVIYDFGILGLSIYTSMIIAILHFGFRQRKILQETSLCLFFVMAIFIIKSAISGVYLDIEANLLFISLGILMGRSSSFLRSLGYQTQQDERINTR
ncbi:O-antigen polymerase [Bacteroidales bacterium KA00251]|nr:O-antigen polymerase [Bacteroidales bacterium KA00251]